MKVPEDYILKCERATEELRKATREAHEAIQGLREAKAAADEALNTRVEEVLATFSSVTTKAAKAEAEQLGDLFRRVTEESSERVFARFDNIMAILMGEEHGEDHNMDALARRVRASMEGHLPLSKTSVPVPEMFKNRKAL